MQRSEQYTEGGVATLLQSGPVQDVDLVSCCNGVCVYVCMCVCTSAYVCIGECVHMYA